jgi:hypothetical protein
LKKIIFLENNYIISVEFKSYLRIKEMMPPVIIYPNPSPSPARRGREQGKGYI